MLLVRDRAALVEAAARSVLGQDLRDLELLVVDDGSCDETPDVLARLAGTDARVRVLRNESSIGIPASRNRALAEARGQFIAICDSDDLSRPGRLHRQVELLESGDSNVVGAGVRISLFSNDPRDGAEPSWHWGLRRGRLPFAFPGGMFRRESLLAVDGFDERFPAAEDLDLCYRLAACGGRFATVDEVLLDYRVHDNAVTSSNHLRHDWCTLRAQLRGVLRHRVDLAPMGYAVIVQSFVRVALDVARLRGRRRVERTISGA